MKVHYKHKNREEVAMIDFHDSSVHVRKKESESSFDYIPTPTGYRFLANGKIYDVTIRTQKDQEVEVFVNNRLVPLEWLDRHRFDYNDSGLKDGARGDLYSVMPGRVVKLHVQKGDVVEKGQPLLILEAMKMENEIKSSTAGKVKKIHVRTGQSVESKTLLISLEPEPNENA